MADNHTILVRSVRLLVLALLLASPWTARGEEDAPAATSPADSLAADRFGLMRDRIKTMIVMSGEAGFPESLSLRPLFRYTDPARGYVAAAVWKLGEAGRPKALVTTELHRQFYGQPRIVYEYLSLTSTPFSATSPDVRWSPQGSSLNFQPVPEAPVPEENPSRRLSQMRAMARQFAGTELVGKEKAELRLLPQPVDRYTPFAADRADGAIFLLAFGTNPEVALLIESDGKGWTYAAGRLSGASQIELTYSGERAWQGEPVKYGSTQPYTASNSAASIPGIAPDGTELDP